MHRRYTIHRDGDLLVEDFDDQGNNVESEPVPAADRLPIEITLKCPDEADHRAAMLDLLDMAMTMEMGEEPQGVTKVEK